MATKKKTEEVAEQPEEQKIEEIPAEQPVETPQEAKGITAEEIIEANPDIGYEAREMVEQPKSLRDIQTLSADETTMILDARLAKILAVNPRVMPPAKSVSLMKYKQSENSPPVDVLFEIDASLFEKARDFYMANAPNATAKGFAEAIMRVTGTQGRIYPIVVTFNMA